MDTPIILDGKAYAAEIRKDLAEIVAEQGLKPCLAIVTVGDDPASEVYVRNKKKACNEIGIECRHIKYPKDISEYQLAYCVTVLCEDKTINGLIVQLPLPYYISPAVISNYIWASKDVDGFKTNSIFRPCTPEGILWLLERYNIPTDGANVVILGRSRIVGQPLARMMLDNNATVTVCHSHTPTELRHQLLKNADIICSAVGEPGLITPEDLSPGVTLVDIAINRDIENKLCGDVNPSCYRYARAYTPVPGGVGPMTVALLMHHVVQATIWQKEGIEIK